VIDKFTPCEDLTANYLSRAHKEYLVFVAFNTLSVVHYLLNLEEGGFDFGNIKALL
jgi:hypothetical protein